MAARRVLITGGGTGIGRASALRFAAGGDHLMLGGRAHALQRVASLEEVARMIVFLTNDVTFVTGGVHPVDGAVAAL